VNEEIGLSAILAPLAGTTEKTGNPQGLGGVNFVQHFRSAPPLFAAAEPEIKKPDAGAPGTAIVVPFAN
jgi:hypothetical protein